MQNTLQPDKVKSVNSWLIYPTWQNFSSLFLEVTTANDEQNDFVKSHHLTSSLYYAISFVEALLNDKYRRRLEDDGITEAEIMSILRRGSSASDPKKGRSFAEKFSEWPSLICGKSLAVSEKLSRVLIEFNDIRGNLTHPKSRGYEVHSDLENVNGHELLEAVAEYGISIYSNLGSEYPHWLFGWNYLNPKGSYNPTRINNQQFLHSLAYLGMPVEAFEANLATAWRDTHMKSFQGYKKIAGFLSTCRDCEPFDPNFPFRPRLARRWWDAEILEKNKNYILERRPPMFFGEAKIALMFISPFELFEEQELNVNK